jgi:oligopeptidase B
MPTNCYKKLDKEIEMKKMILMIAGAALWLSVLSCAHKTQMAPVTEGPHPVKIPHEMSKFGDIRQDDYFWLKERENPKVIDYLNAENAYTEKALAPAKALEEKIFNEMKSRVKEDDSTFPYRYKDYFYYSRFEKGQQYPIYARKKGSIDAPEEILFNVNEISNGHAFCQATPPAISPNQQMIVYGVDLVGRRFYTLHFKDLKTGKELDAKIENVTGNMDWAADSDHLFYTQQHPETLRSDKVFRYSLSGGKSDLMYFEKDETFSVDLYKSLTRKFIYIASSSTLTTETLYLPSDKPMEKFKVFAPREHEHEYSVTDGDDAFYIISNKKAKNFQLLKADFKKTAIKDWKIVVAHNPDIFLNNVTVFKNFLAIEERRAGLTQIHILAKNKSKDFTIPFADQSYLVSAGSNAEYDTDTFRYEYESMRLPESTYDYDMARQKEVLRKVKEVPNYNPELYVAERIFVKARDGASVPVSILRRKDTPLNNSAPMLVYGYGAYGINMDPWFSQSIFSLVERGYIYAIAHIRGGSEMGRAWYEAGRTDHKKNTFTDFVDSTEGLIKKGYASPHRIFAMGGSAGGLLMGAVYNMRPDLYEGVVAQVPFVDVITTMLDDSIPLTTGEYDEWGNPNQQKPYQYIRSYSPYDNVEKKDYTNLLVTTGLHDSQVQYWEPAKWVAKLREVKTNPALILLKTDMSAGHGGASGRFDRLKESATEYAFILMVDGRN